MNLHFKSQAKIFLLDFCNMVLFFVLCSVLLSFLAHFHWFFNLFDQFWPIYLTLSFLLILIFVFFKKQPQVILSLIVFFICLAVVYKKNTHKFVKIASGYKIYYQNINSSNSSLVELSKKIRGSAAEFVTLVESTPEIERLIKTSLKDYTQILSLSRDDNFGFLILSKTKIKLEEVHERSEIPIYVKFFIEKYNMTIYLLHLPPPLWKEAWEIQKETLALILKEINTNKKQSFLILGDLNMTTLSSQFQDFYTLLNPEFSSQELNSLGTWPSFMPKFLSLPIDHVLSNRNFEMEIGPAVGSDHRSIIIKMDAFTK
jgi:endonuclease/exonuclease/phosphatase (EEP) superfamily protein YafD